MKNKIKRSHWNGVTTSGGKFPMERLKWRNTEKRNALIRFRKD